MDARVMIEGRWVYITTHAIERYRERVRPALGVREVHADLARLLPQQEFTSDRPVWAVGDLHGAHEWVTIADAIAFPVVANRLVTCLTRGEVGAELRIVKQRERREERERDGRRGKRKKHGKVARDARREARARRAAAIE